MPIYLGFVSSFFCALIEELSSHERDRVPHDVENRYTVVLHRQHLSTPDLEEWHDRRTFWKGRCCKGMPESS